MVRKPMRGMTGWERVLFHGWTVTDAGCWEFHATNTVRGYGRVTYGGTENTGYAHRLSYQHYVGEIPDGKILRHRCDNRICINPNHLQLGTKRENSQDMVDRGRSLKGERHHKSKLTEQDVRDIRDEYAKGVLTQRMIGETYGVSDAQISHIVSRKGWAHVK